MLDCETPIPRCVNCITPPYLLKKLLESPDREVRDAAFNTLLSTARLRGEREVRAVTFAASPGGSQRTIFDCKHSVVLASALLVRAENDPPTNDESVNQAFDGLGVTLDFYRKVFSRNSIDGHGMRLDGYVHRGNHYNNAFWDGQEMIFGDGDGRIFGDFTGSIDVIAHELTHGVTEFTANLEYHKESGALNESISDVFGSLVKQWKLGQAAEQADWLIGAEIFTPNIDADGLRSMRAPGTAYDNDLLGRDPQPDHMDRFEHLPDTDEGDWGGVHINSGIPNKAFYLTAVGIGGKAWEAAGHIWFESLRASNQFTRFQDFADTTVAKAGALYGTGSIEQKTVIDAWREVGIKPASTLAFARAIAVGGDWATPDKRGTAGGDGLEALNKKIEQIATQFSAITAEIAGIKERRKR